jgi:pimeloyl-ACP methyl ester carboxylesterase
MKHVLFVLALTVLCAPFFLVQAQVPCGNIIAPSGWGDGYVEPDAVYVNQSITDCSSPFGLLKDSVSPNTLDITGTRITDGSTIIIDTDGTKEYEIIYNFPNDTTYYVRALFRHEATDYRYVRTEPVTPTEQEYRIMAAVVFDTQADIDTYVARIMTDDPWGGLESGTPEYEAMDTFYDYVTANFNTNPHLALGTYTLVFKEYMDSGGISLYQRVSDYFVNLFMPTAYAQSPTDPNTYTITFTLANPAPGPVGASSVLFLPGIQASELEMKREDGSENTLWVPDALFNQDVQMLAMNVNGESVHDVYTTRMLPAIPFGGSVYDSFGRFMVQLVADEVIKEWTPFAYDWRYSVTDIAQNGTKYEEGIRDAVDEIERLASSSFSGKVTIIGHSNGGLLAKAVMQRLEDEGKTNLVDKVVLLAVPQLGTPKTIGTILHGYDQTDDLSGLIINAQNSREIINNLPGAYGLLPSEKYFEGLSEPIVTFSGDSIINPYRNVYGASISDYAEYTNFIRGADGLDRDLGNPVSTPARTNSSMLDESLALHATQLDLWSAPEGVAVIEIVGTGLPTMKGVEYRGIVEDKCLITFPLNVFCTPEAEIKPYAVLTRYGDGTVVQRSAEGYEGENVKYFVNLKQVKKIFLTSNFVHHNIAEAPPLQDLLSDILISTSTENNQFISTTYTTFDDVYDIEIIDSPVRLLATDALGNQTGIIIVDGVKTIQENIPGSQYFEFGDTKYFVVPKGTNRTTKLYGEEYGGYTLTTATLNSSDVQEIKTTLQNATVTPSLIAEYSNTGGEFSTVVTDENGDGTIDYETTLDGELIEEEVVVTYPLLIATIEALNITKVRKQALLLIIKSAEYYANKTPSKLLYRNLEDGLLRSAQELIKLYVKKQYLTVADAAVLQEMIQVLKDKQ